MSGIYENEAQVRELYLKTNLEDITDVQATLKNIEENAYVQSKLQYTLALKAANPSNLAKARRYNSLTLIPCVKYLGWIIMAIFAIWMGVQDWGDDATWQSLGFWIGVGIQIYIAVLKSPWNTLTLNGAVMHPSVTGGTTTSSETVVANNNCGKTICKNCGFENEKASKFCESCGTKMMDD